MGWWVMGLASHNSIMCLLKCGLFKINSFKLVFFLFNYCLSIIKWDKWNKTPSPQLEVTTLTPSNPSSPSFFLLLQVSKFHWRIHHFPLILWARFLHQYCSISSPLPIASSSSSFEVKETEFFSPLALVFSATAPLPF